MPQWDKIATISALCFVIFTILPNLSLFRSLCIFFVRRLPLEANQCTQLLWDDIPEGLLHECSSPTPYVCEHTIPHKSRKAKCWEDLFPVVFTRAWADEGRKSKRVPKPEILPWTQDFIRIDFTILVAFIFSTVGCHKDLGSLLWGISTYTGSDKFVFDVGGVQRLYLKSRDQCLVAHLFAESCRPWTPDSDKTISAWTKAEIENLLNGYPPFYSATFLLHGKIRIDFPIHSRDDIRKGGWVLAVKLGNISRALPFYFESQFATVDTTRKPTFQLATEWVRDMVAEPFTKSFPGNVNVSAALNALNRLCRGQEHISCALERSDLDEHVASTLNKEEAVRAMGIFNRPTLMTSSQRADLKADSASILVPLLSAAVFGVRDVLRFEKRCIDLKERLPATLRPSSEIYVGDCSRTGFDAARRYPRIDGRQKS
jgi:hypothetical protein